MLINTQANSLKWVQSSTPNLPLSQIFKPRGCNSRIAATLPTTTHPAQELQFGPLDLTRMMCSSAAINEPIPKHWDYVRSYLLNAQPIFNRSNPRPSS